MLFNYQQQTQRLLDDQKEEKFNLSDLTAWINSGRNKVAADSQCIRVLVPSNGGFATATVGAGGSGYTSAPTVTVSAPDSFGAGFTQAVITATVGGGAITGFNIVTAGTGYVNPTVTITGGGGTGGVCSFTLTPFLSTAANQEIYTFAAASALIGVTGVGAIFAIQNISVAWGSQKPTLSQTDWSSFQAYYRAQNIGATNWPFVWAQYGHGDQGSAYIYPIPSQKMQMDWDCYCLPSPMLTDADPEFIPYPFSEAVPYYAAYQAMMTKDIDKAKYFEEKYRSAVKEARAWATPAMIPNFYEGPF